ncbi:DUF3040 domain-containing protein [Naumannella halotolerans]|uniref:DUF3040 family protein n=1 Tax=Naumannella halotolerans TaxID=993414 RepID=A0A4V6Q2D1_9ACTN|nr:DUF3040 domain-containing protein [Naumannella halotolerans]TDT32798.1 Protein of unknown function (DUF3040) [Naumannella halotolerans]
MALSEEEQRLLDQMEAAFRKEDPTLANRLSGATPRRLRRRRATIAGIGFVLGLGLLVGGLQVNPIISIGGFVLMLAATVVAITSWNGPAPSGSRRRGKDRRTTSVRTEQGPQQRQRRAGGDNKNFMERMEERWRRRQEDGF